MKLGRSKTVNCGFQGHARSYGGQNWWITLREYQASLISRPVWFVTFTNLPKATRVAKLCFTLTKYSKSFDSSKYVWQKQLRLQNTPNASLQRDKIPFNKCPGYDTKQSNGEAQVMLELWGIWSNPSLLSLSGPFW